uniref:Uncharacterized protein n=1 Tax=Anopheles minimus TaxID=112268 RepID=A0A182WMT5_9DIPT
MKLNEAKTDINHISPIVQKYRQKCGRNHGKTIREASSQLLKSCVVENVTLVKM